MRQLWLTEQTPDDARLPTEIDSASAGFVHEASLTDTQRQLVTLLPPADVLETLQTVEGRFQVVMLDPWYNKGVGGVREDYLDWLTHVIDLSARLAPHVFVWGFPEIIARLLDRLPPPLSLVAWLTWYYKNCPSVIRGWRSAQYTCLHLAKPEATLYPEHFLNEAQLEKQRQGKLRYMPGPPSVIEAPLNIGFVGRSEQTGHPSQKPEKVLEPLYRMTTKAGDTVLDPMCGAGTSGVVCARLGVRSVLCDVSEQYSAIVERRLGIVRRPESDRPKSWLSRLD
ncbi:MAG: site-specific DNA-methyltransferase [Planctomycetia bacterium]|nr:site-specific DNA-methyltransferase [Planctomycetia bacterium]